MRLQARTELVLLAAAIGVSLIQLFPVLPNLVLASTLFTIAIAASIFISLRPNKLGIAWISLWVLLLGASYGVLRADLRLSHELSREWEGRDIEIVGVIDELPQRNDRCIRFAFDVEQVLTRNVVVPPRIALGWYKPSIKELQGEALPALRAGERWRWTVRLKRPHGYVNGAGFDVEAWMLENNLRASGSIQVDEPVKRIDANAGRFTDYIERFRERIRDRMQQVLQDKRYAGVLIALAVGDQRAIREGDWALFNATAVSHLLSISGAHVTLFATWIASLVFALWRRSPRLANALPAQKAAALAAAFIALAYAALSGFAVPAQRTCYMLLTASFALMLSRTISPWLILCWSLVVVLAIDPWASLAVGFWFSFLAVAFLLYVTHGHVGSRPWWRTALITQAAVTIGLAPLAVAFFQQVSLVGPLANAIAIPLISFVVIPLTLLWLMLPIDALLTLAHDLVNALASFLQWLTTLPTTMWSQHAPSWWTVLLAIAGCAWLLAPRGVRYRWIGVLWCLPLFTITPTRPDIGEFSMTVLDIGQGTSVVVRTATRTLVYDTGPRWTDDTDAGSQLIAPYLRASGSSKIDGLVVSHLDIDHSGGAKSLLKSTPTEWLLTSMFAESDVVRLADERGTRAYGCRAGQSWQWDGVQFEIVHPNVESYANAKLKTNDRSCVLRISATKASALLTGDIEALSETELVARALQSLRANALLIPHHGSLTSSTGAFIEAVKPSIALINAGYRNRFGHPREDVLARYAQRNIPVHRSDWHGAITIDSKDGFATARRERDARQRYWVDRVDSTDRRPIE
jgi:competence protein ComEC